uniref:Probable purine permease n=1 Tax=Opuntia streptacantha TaxID=393608 RepID=A0A7C9CLK8_OPUST
MDSPQDLHKQAIGKEGEQRPKGETKDRALIIACNQTSNFSLPKIKHLKWWLRVMTYIICLLVGQTVATLLGRLYYDRGGNSKWMATLVQSAGFPILLPLLSFASEPAPSPSTNGPSLFRLILLYFGLGLVFAIDNLMYSYGLLYLPVSTYSLLCATQLAFNAVSSYFINAQKFTILVLNSLVLLSISASLLAINVNDDDTSSDVYRGKYIVGFLCTLGASATYSLVLSLIQLSFERVIKSRTFKVVLEMQVYPSFVATIASVVGLFASGEWRSLTQEMMEYKKGRVSYAMTLAWTAIAWQVSSIGLLGLVFEVSSLFSNVIGTLGLPLVPVFAVVFFHDKMNGVKVIALVLAIWGFLSYIYQHYLDDVEDKKALQRSGEEETNVTIELVN